MKTLSLRETVVLADVAEKAVRKDIEDRILVPLRVENRPRFRWADVLVLAAVYGNHRLDKKLRKAALKGFKSRFALHPDGRRASAAGDEPLKLDNYLYLDFKAVRTEIAPRVELYERGLDRIESKPDILSGEAVFKKTRLPVRHIGKLAAYGEPVDSILKDYPYLSADDVAFAVLYDEAHRPVGRPRKSKAA